ncbi:hypothetical protein [Vitiosangium sp. GDMCC 1.1324]|uniref:hypothetical protein n=1 Tax=Vitiosangium sp. (strain GDMCC 1.1324) TaxID=2138576 RepID=UPI000D34B51D|nr:hypothetical protein [Vitiosangium sp. GDMCC 1.1324]PTL85014.1 hypothetical protein DAT35_08215 [Vitiosangium sp. GDMCC 1.1324]
MNSKDIQPKWVVHVHVESVNRTAWLAWSSLARLLEMATELATEPNTFARVSFSDETLETLQQLLLHVEECHAAYERFAQLRCRMHAARLARAANELHARATTLSEELAQPAYTRGLSREQLESRRSLCSTWDWIQGRLVADADVHVPVPECSGDAEIRIDWGW